MKKKQAWLALGLMVSNLTFAGGLLTNTNQNVAFLRNPARDAAIGIDGVYSNPAGVAFLPQGFHVSLNFQSAYQTRTVTSTFQPFAYGVGNDGATKVFKGDAKAPVIPSLQAAYNRDRWSFSFNFSIGGGGGKCEFDEGLGSFESQAALLPVLGESIGIKRYSLDSYMRGRQYYYGFQIGAAYKITDHLSAFVGGRLVYATCNYYGYVKNVSINHPEGDGMVNASGYFGEKMTSLAAQAGALKVQAENYIAIAENYKAIAEDLMAAGDLNGAQQAAAAATQYTEGAQAAASGAQAAASAARQMGGLAVATQDVELNCDQTGWGFTPIIGLDYKIGRFNFAAKYEFKTKIRLENRAANSKSAENLAMLDKYRDGNKVKEDIPGILTLGAQYEILPSLRVMAGYHHYFDKQASWEGDVQKALKRGTNEYLFGAEYDICQRLQVSAGWQNTSYGLSDDYMKDMSFNVSSNTMGIGVGIQATKNIKVNLAYFQTFYKTYNKSTDDYNNISHTVNTLMPGTGDALVAKGDLAGTDAFTRTNKVFGVGIDFSF